MQLHNKRTHIFCTLAANSGRTRRSEAKEEYLTWKWPFMFLMMIGELPHVRCEIDKPRAWRDWARTSEAILFADGGRILRNAIKIAVHSENETCGHEDDVNCLRFFLRFIFVSFMRNCCWSELHRLAEAWVSLNQFSRNSNRQAGENFRVCSTSCLVPVRFLLINCVTFDSELRSNDLKYLRKEHSTITTVFSPLALLLNLIYYMRYVRSQVALTKLEQKFPLKKRLGN